MTGEQLKEGGESKHSQGIPYHSLIDNPKRASVALSAAASTFPSNPHVSRVTSLTQPLAAMSNPESLANVALRPWPAPAKDALSKEEVSAQIHQLTTERGHLRGITEKVLQDEINAGQSFPEDGMEGIESGSKKGAPVMEEKLKEIYRVRNEIHGKIEYVLGEVMSTLFGS